MIHDGQSDTRQYKLIRVITCYEADQPGYITAMHQILNVSEYQITARDTASQIWDGAVTWAGPLSSTGHWI